MTALAHWYGTVSLSTAKPKSQSNKTLDPMNTANTIREPKNSNTA